MKLKQFIMDDNVQQEFLDTAKEFLDKAKELGFPFSGITTATFSEKNGDKEVSTMTSLYLYRGNSHTPSHIIELLEEYAIDTFMDDFSNWVSIYRVQEYIVVTIIAST